MARVLINGQYPLRIIKDGREVNAMYKRRHDDTTSENIKVWRFPARTGWDYPLANQLPAGYTWNDDGGYYEKNNRRISEIGRYVVAIKDYKVFTTVDTNNNQEHDSNNYNDAVILEMANKYREIKNAMNQLQAVNNDMNSKFELNSGRGQQKAFTYRHHPETGKLNKYYTTNTLNRNWDNVNNTDINTPKYPQQNAHFFRHKSISDSYIYIDVNHTMYSNGNNGANGIGGNGGVKNDPENPGITNTWSTAHLKGVNIYNENFSPETIPAFLIAGNNNKVIININSDLNFGYSNHYMDNYVYNTLLQVVGKNNTIFLFINSTITTINDRKGSSLVGTNSGNTIYCLVKNGKPINTRTKIDGIGGFGLDLSGRESFPFVDWNY